VDDIPYFEPKSHLRIEDHRLVTGTGRYVADLAPPGTVQLAFVRSTEAHARITGLDIDTDRGDGAFLFTPPSGQRRGPLCG
jgi:CO/xanthine dehydrogenase Mo-binding subunit